ncbi:hypothetical protein ACWD25_45670, partial [Streptomyces sp. NPDC002920]
MSRDMGDSPASRPRMLKRAQVGWPRPLRELKDLLYEVYLAAGAPSLDEIAEAISADDGLPGSPGRDTVRRCISEPVLPPSQADTVSVAVVLARSAAWNTQDLAARVRSLWITARMATGAGRPISEFDDRLVLVDLEVHPALDAGADDDRLSALPAYVAREFDARLNAVIADAAAGQSSIALLVGGSSTGKTRAMWEAVRQLPDRWRLWHPIDPTRPDAALAELTDIAPHTVVWLNEAQDYLGLDPLGEQVAAGLRSLLRDPGRAPVLILATLWPEHWETLTIYTDSSRRSHTQELLNKHKIDVPDAFTSTELASLADTADADPRLGEAATRAHDAQITQYLAGVPVLLDRYHGARGATQALIHAAMDARRLGAGPHIPLAWLADAAPGYLTDTEWNQTPDNWLPQALAYVTTPCNGIPGILSPVKTSTPRNHRPAIAGSTAWQPTQTVQATQYQLTDYLDQYGRLHRADQIPPIDFWTAAASHAHPADLTDLGNSAKNRGLYRDAAQLHKRATAHGSPYAARALVHLFHTLHPTDQRPSQWAVAHATLDDPEVVSSLLGGLLEAGADQQIATLLARDPATHAHLDSPDAVARLLAALREAGADQQFAILAERAVAHARLDRPGAMSQLLAALHKGGADRQAAVLAERAVAHATLDDPNAVAQLLGGLRKAGADQQIATLLARDPATHAHLDDPGAVRRLMEELRGAGADQLAAVLAERAVAHATLDDPDAVAQLLGGLRKAGADQQIATLLARDPATHAHLGQL